MATGTFRSDLQSDITRADHERFPELFYEGPMIDRSKATRVVPMRVMVFGLMRTGTSCTDTGFLLSLSLSLFSIPSYRENADILCVAMRVALSRMGFDEVYHMVSVWHNPDDAQWWQRAADASWENKGTFTREDWDKLLGHCQVSSTPGMERMTRRFSYVDISTIPHPGCVRYSPGRICDRAYRSLSRGQSSHPESRCRSMVPIGQQHRAPGGQEDDLEENSLPDRMATIRSAAASTGSMHVRFIWREWPERGEYEAVVH